MNRLILAAGACAVILAGIVMVVLWKAPSPDPHHGVTVVTATPRATETPAPGAPPLAQRLLLRAPLELRRDHAAMMAQPPAPAGLEQALRSQLRFIGDGAGAPTFLECRAARCMLVGEIAGAEREAATAALLQGSALSDTLATWQLARGKRTVIPPKDGASGGFVLFIERRDAAGGAR